VTLERELADEGEDSEGEILGFGEPPAPWRMTVPFEAKADSVAVDGVLGQIAGIEKVRVLEEGTAADYGLEPPQFRVELVTPTASEWIDIGSELPASSRRVARIGEEGRLYLIEAPFVAAMSKAAGDWRDRRLFPGERRSIQSVRLRGAHGEVLLAKRGDRFWLESPATDVADRDGVEALLGAVTEITAETFVDVPPASDEDLGLDPTVSSIEVVLQGQEKPFRIVLGRGTASEAVPNGEGTDDPAAVAPSVATSRYARVGDALVTTNAALAGPLGQSADEWRSRAWMTVPTYDIEKVVIDGVEPSLVLTRDGVDWKRGDETIEYTVVNRFLTTLAGLRAEGVETNGSPSGLPARLTIDLTAKDGTLTTLGLSGVDGEDEWGTSSGRPLGLRLPSGTLEQLNEALDAIRSAEVLVVDPEPEIPGETLESDQGGPAGAALNPS
jgi:hypothetical protein